MVVRSGLSDGAVQIVTETGKPVAQVARELGINAGTLIKSPRSRWRSPQTVRSSPAVAPMEPCGGGMWPTQPPAGRWLSCCPATLAPSDRYRSHRTVEPWPPPTGSRRCGLNNLSAGNTSAMGVTPGVVSGRRRQGRTFLLRALCELTRVECRDCFHEAIAFQLVEDVLDGLWWIGAGVGDLANGCGDHGSFDSELIQDKGVGHRRGSDLSPVRGGPVSTVEGGSEPVDQAGEPGDDLGEVAAVGLDVMTDGDGTRDPLSRLDRRRRAEGAAYLRTVRSSSVGVAAVIDVENVYLPAIVCDAVAHAVFAAFGRVSHRPARDVVA